MTPARNPRPHRQPVTHHPEVPKNLPKIPTQDIRAPDVSASRAL
jgi:hypothetical protein